MTMKMREAVSSHCCYVYFIVCGLHCYQHSCLRFVWNIKLFFTTNIDVAKDYQNEDCIRGNETLNFITLHNFRKTRVEVTVWEANSHCVCFFFLKTNAYMTRWQYEWLNSALIPGKGSLCGRLSFLLSCLFRQSARTGQSLPVWTKTLLPGRSLPHSVHWVVSLHLDRTGDRGTTWHTQPWTYSNSHHIIWYTEVHITSRDYWIQHWDYPMHSWPFPDYVYKYLLLCFKQMYLL